MIILNTYEGKVDLSLKMDIVLESRRRIDIFLNKSDRLPTLPEYNHMGITDKTFKTLSMTYFDGCNYREFIYNWLGYPKTMKVYNAGNSITFLKRKSL